MAYNSLILLVLSIWGFPAIFGQELGDAPFLHCPERWGVQVYPHPTHCDHFYRCENGTLTHETCANGLLFDGKGSVHNHCNYYWAVECGERKLKADPISTEYCPYLWGIFAISPQCHTTYLKCEEGVPHETGCEPGLVYDDRSHTCNWPDLLENCNSEAVVNFQCPGHVTGLSARFIPFPRFAYPHDCTRYVVCVNNKPRLTGCGDGSGFNQETLTCDDLKHLPGCKPF